MDSSNASDFAEEDNLESSFTEISSIEMDMAKIIEKMQKMETKLLKFDIIEKELREENGKLKDQIAVMNANFTELYAKQDADKLMLTILIDDRINAHQQMPPKFDSIELKKNKMDLADCAPKLSFAANELLVTSNDDIGWRCARAILPVPKFNRKAKEKYIAFYFEGHIKKSSCYGVGMGFCSLQFPLEDNYNGNQQNSIGIHCKDGMHICGKFESFKKEKEYFKAGDKIGLGLIYEPKNASVKCFAICNRKLLGSVELTAKFYAFPIFPAVSLSDSGNSIQLNFGQEDWDFDPRQIIHLIQ